MSSLTGYEAIAFAERFGLFITKKADPTEGKRDDLDAKEARKIAKEDPSLLHIDAPAFDPERMLATYAAIGNDGSRPVVWGLGTDAQMAVADALRQNEFEPEDAAFLRVVEVGPEVQERVQHGDVSWSNA